MKSKTKHHVILTGTRFTQLRCG